MSSAFVSGARGFVGSRLVKELATQGKRVHAFIRPGSELSEEIQTLKNVIVFHGDLRDAAALESATQGCSQAYHLAALAQPWAKDMSLFQEVNVKGTLNVLNACLKNGTQDILITSSAGMFGPQQSVKPVNEQTIPASWFSEYEKTKWESVEASKQFLNKGLNIRFVSPTRVFGPGELSTSNAVTKLIHQYMQGKFRFVPGTGHGIGNYAFIDDVVAGHLLAMSKGNTGENYILGGENVSYRYLFDTVGTLSGKKYKLFGVPLFIMLSAASLMEQWANLTGKPPLITPPFVRKYAHDWGTDLSKARDELGYEVTPIGNAIKKTMDWINSRQTQS
jgi:nucleoside-diphosphate-sugar epimerase